LKRSWVLGHVAGERLEVSEGLDSSPAVSRPEPEKSLVKACAMKASSLKHFVLCLYKPDLYHITDSTYKIEDSIYKAVKICHCNFGFQRPVHITTVYRTYNLNSQIQNYRFFKILRRLWMYEERRNYLRKFFNYVSGAHQKPLVHRGFDHSLKTV
jgi:hypothetical protein